MTQHAAVALQMARVMIGDQLDDLPTTELTPLDWKDSVCTISIGAEALLGSL